MHFLRVTISGTDMLVGMNTLIPQEVMGNFVPVTAFEKVSTAVLDDEKLIDSVDFRATMFVTTKLKLTAK